MSVTAVSERERKLRSSVVTSIVAKVSASAVQFAAIPIAISALGLIRFGVYASITSLLAWLSVASVGIGPGLTRAISLASSRKAYLEERAYFVSAFWVIASVVLAVTALILVASLYFPLSALFGDEYQTYSVEANSASYIVVVLAAAQIILGIVDFARMGYQEIYITNIFTIGSNVLALVFAVAVSVYLPTISALVLAISLPVVIAKALSLYTLVRSRPHLKPSLRGLDTQVARELVSSGAAFFLVQLSGFLNQQLTIFFVGRIDGPSAVAELAIFFRIVSLLGSVVVMFTQPLWPAILHERSTGSRDWGNKMFTWLLIGGMVYAVGSTLALNFNGGFLVKLWLGERGEVPISLVKSLIVYFPLVVWSNINHTYLVGAGSLWPQAIAFVTESVIGVAVAFILLPTWGTTAIPLGLALACVVVTAWFLPYRAWSRHF